MLNNFALPVAIVMGKQLSVADGPDVYRFSKGQKSTCTIPIIRISGNMNIGTMAYKAGADNFVENLFNIDSLLEAVKKYV